MGNGIEHAKLMGRALGGSSSRPGDLSRSHAIFLLEDDVELLTAFTRMLIGAGFFVSASQLAEHALAALTSNHPVDLVIADLVLPGMNGEEFCARVAQLRPGTPFIVMTGSDTVIDLTRFPPNTAAIYKPFRRQDVMELIEAALVQGAWEVPGSMVGRR